MAEIITWLNTKPDKSGDRIIPKVRTKGVYDDKNKSLDEKMPFDFGVNEDKYGYYNSKGELIPFEKCGIKKWSELQEKPFEDIGHMLGVDDKQSLYAENYIAAEWDINKKYYLNDFCIYKKKIYRRINETPEGIDFDLAKPETVFKTAGEFIMYPWRHNKYNNDLAYAAWGINNGAYCLYMCSIMSPDGARSVASGLWGSEVSPEPGYVDFLGERFFINFQWYGNSTSLNLSTRAGLPQITPVNNPEGGLNNLETLKNLLYTAGIWDGTDGRILPPDESSRWVLADSKYIFDYVKTIKNDFSWSEIKEKPFASIDKNTLEVQDDELIVKKQAWNDIINKPFENVDNNTVFINEDKNIEVKNIIAKEWNAEKSYSKNSYVRYNYKIYRKINDKQDGELNSDNAAISDGIDTLQTPDKSVNWEEVPYLADEITNAIIEGANEWGDIKNKPFSDIDPNTLEVKDNILTVIGGGGEGGISELPENLVYYSNEEENIGLPSVNPTMIFSDLDYSTEEQLTGKRWIDGKPIYQKTIYGTTSGSNNTWVDTGIIISDVDVFISVEKGIRNPIEWNMYDDRVNVSIIPSTGAVKVKQDISSSNVEYTFYVVLQYTKTTDTAESPVNIPTLSKLPFELGIDDEGNYGYIKNGENTVTPFGQNPNGYARRDINYVFMSFKENISDTVSTSSGIEPIPFTDIESSGLTVEDNKVKLEEGHKYFIIASAQNPTAHYINICNKDGIYVMNGSDGNYQATTQSCIYIAKKDDVIYLGVSNNNGGAGSVRRNSTFTVIELSGSSSGSSGLEKCETIWSGLTELDTSWHDLTLAKSIDNYDYLIVSYWNLASSGGCEHAGYMLIPKIDFYLSSTYPGEEDYTFFCGDNISTQSTGIAFRIKDKNTLTYKNVTNVSGFKTAIRAIYGIKSTDTVDSPVAKPTTLHNYSTEEQIVGTWIDGKPLYEKTIVAENESGFARFETIYQNDMENIISVEKVMLYNSGEGHWISERFTVFPLGLDWNDNVVNFRHDQVGYDGVIKKIRFTIQYTKTTDTATT